MATVTIPKELARKGDLVLIPRREYEALLHGAKKQSIKKDWLYQEPFATELKKRINISKKELKEGKLIEWNKH